MDLSNDTSSTAERAAELAGRREPNELAKPGSRLAKQSSRLANKQKTRRADSRVAEEAAERSVTPCEMRIGGYRIGPAADQL
jgi:hypothetical protein